MESERMVAELSDDEAHERQHLKELFQQAWSASDDDAVAALEALIETIDDTITRRENVVIHSRFQEERAEYSTDSYRRLMDETARPVLEGRREEYRLFWIYHVGRAAEQRLQAPEQGELIEQHLFLAQAGQWAFDELLQSNIRLVSSVAKSRGVKQQDLLDYMSVGILGLRSGIEQFDPERATKFSTYARPKIFAEMQKYSAQIRGSHRLSAGMLTDLNAIRRVRADLVQRGASDDVDAIVEHTGLSPDRVREIELIYTRATQTIQLDATVFRESDMNLHETIAETDSTQFTDLVEDNQMVQALVGLMHEIGLFDEQIKMVLHEAGLLNGAEKEEVLALKKKMGGTKYKLWFDRARRKLSEAGAYELITGAEPTDNV